MSNKIQKEVYDILYAIKPQRNYIGYFQAISVLIICCENKKKLHSLYKMVYPQVAQQFECNPLSIERNIRVFLQNIDYSKLSVIIKFDIYEPLTVKEFIFLITSHIDRKSHT